MHGEATQPAGRRSRKTRPTTQPSPIPLDPVTFVNKINVPDVHGLPVGGRADRRALCGPGRSTSPARPRSGSPSPTAPTSTRSIRPRSTAVRLPRAVRRRTRRRSSTQRSSTPRRRVIYQEAMGLPEDRRRDPAVGSDPDRTHLRSGAGGLRSAAGRSGCCSTTARAPRRPARKRPGDPYPGFEAVLLGLPGPGHHGRIPGTSGPAERWTNSCPPPRHDSDSYTSNASALPLTDFGGNTGAGGLWGNASQWEWNWEQPPAGSAVSFVSAPLASNTTVDRRRRRASLGQVIDPGRRPPGDGQRSAARRQRDVRAGRLAAGERAQARHQREQHLQAAADRAASRSRRSSRPTLRPMPAGKFVPGDRSRCTSRATPTAPARVSG